MSKSENPTNVVVANSPFDDPNADLVILSSDGALFYVHSLLLSPVSPLFNTMFTLPSPTDKVHSQKIHDGHPLVTVSDDAKHLRLLLSWCDPRCMQIETCLSDLQMVLEMADKYDVASVIKRVESVLMLSKETIKENPLKIYAIALRYRREGLARVAAKETLRSNYPLVRLDGKKGPELKHPSAFAFEEYQLRCVAAAVKVVSEYSWMSHSGPGRKFSGMSYFMGSCTNYGDKCPTIITSFGTFLVWWINYMELSAEALKQAPVGSSVMEPLLLSQIHSQISSGKCTSCHSQGHAKLSEFAGFLAVKVDRAISKVTGFLTISTPVQWNLTSPM